MPRVSVFERMMTIMLAALAGVGTAGCAPKAAPAALVVFPAPPDTARFQFLTRFESAADVGDGRSLVEKIAGTEDDGQRAIRKPYGLGMARGRVCVGDIELHTVVVLDLVKHRLALIDPGEKTRFVNPTGCFVDPRDGRIYVADTGAGQVVVFDSLLQYVTAFAHTPDAKPIAVSADDDRLWVSDIGTRSVRAYERTTLDPVLQLPLEGDSAGALAQPVGLAVTEDAVYVSDGVLFTVKVYDHEGHLLRTVGSLGRGPGEFARNKGVAVDRAGRIYVVDAAFENVQVFDADGQVLTYVGGPYKGPGYLYLPAQVIVDYDDVALFERFVAPQFRLKHLVLVTNQFGPDKVTVYGFVEPRER